jgi:hypothetical protein
MRWGTLFYAIKLKQLDILDNNSDVPIRNPAQIFSRLLTRCLLGRSRPERRNVMVKITKRIVEAAEAREKDYLIWDDELPGFGVRVFSSGKRSYVIQYRTRGGSRRYTIGLHGAWALETARREAKVQLGRVAGGDDPVEDRQLDHKAITVRELCTRYLADLQAGLILGKGGRPKKASMITTDTGRIERHIIPLLGTRRVKDLTKTGINKVLKDIMAGKTRVSVKTKKLRGKAIVRGGAATATRTVGLLGGILTYAVEAGIIESNPAHGIRKPKDNVRKRRLSEAEYRILGQMLRDAAKQDKYTTIVDIIRQLALTGCRRSEIIGGEFNRSLQHILRTSQPASDIARSFGVSR